MKQENLADYPQLVEVLQPWGMQYVVDAGSNDGFSTWLFARALPNATVIAIEANLGNYLMTRLNTQSLSNVHTVHAALWRSSETLRVAGQRLGNVGINAVPMNIRARSSETVAGVEMQTLMEKACFPRVDFLKMDIEGGEMNVLADKPRWLRKVRFFWMEAHPNGGNSNMTDLSQVQHHRPLEPLLDTLLGAGLMVFTVPNQRHPARHGKFVAREWMFLGCASSETTADVCMDWCRRWRRGTGVTCSRVMHRADFWGTPHTKADCQLPTTGLPMTTAAAKELCLGTASEREQHVTRVS